MSHVVDRSEFVPKELPAIARSSASAESYSRAESKHIPELDVLRGAAILLVVVYHAIDGTAPYTMWHGMERAIAFSTSHGWLGVPLFFVISGFLITGILSDSRQRSTYYRTFYIRRALRILPVYLLTLTLLKATGMISWRYLLAAVLFIANMPKLVGTGAEYGPFWSLAVEEQFYLAWPAIVRSLRPNRLLLLIIGICVGSPLLRLATAWYFPERDTFYKTYMIADNLAYGGLIALGLRERFITQSNKRRIVQTLVALCAPACAFVMWYRAESDHSRLGEALLRAVGTLPFIGIFVVAVLVASTREISSQPRRVRGWLLSPLLFLGYISYGLYAVHQFVFFSYDRAVADTRFAEVRSDFAMLCLRMLVGGGLSIGLAYLSRRFFEERFLRLKSTVAPTIAK